MINEVSTVTAWRRLLRLLVRVRSEPGLRREADMMGLTTCIVLIAALSAGSDHAPHSRLEVLTVVWGATVGVAVTHWFAMTWSARLVRDPTLAYAPTEVLFGQLLMATLVAGTSTVVVLLLASEFDRLGARVTAAVFLGALVAVEGRAGGSSRGRSLLIGTGALAVGLTVAFAKRLVTA